MNGQQTYDKLVPIFNMMDKGVICQSVTDNGDGTYTFACNRTRWACKGYDITILGIDYTITNVVYNTSITVSGASLPNVLTFDLYAGFFKHGTLRVVASELTKVPSYKDKLPLVFQHEATNENINMDVMNPVELESEVRLYFLTDCDFKNWNQTDGDTKAVAPMRNYLNEFLKCLSNNQWVAELKNVGTVRSYNHFGNVDDKGVLKNALNDFLSGVELRISIPFLRECDCCTDNTLDTRPAPGYVTDPDGNILAVLYSNEYYISTGGVCAGVTITDQDGNILSTVASGGNYDVTVLTEIRDTIDGNTSTIIDNLN